MTLDFNAALAVRAVRIQPSPAADGRTRFALTDSFLRLHVVPDERQYTLVLER